VLTDTRYAGNLLSDATDWKSEIFCFQTCTLLRLTD